MTANKQNGRESNIFNTERQTYLRSVWLAQKKKKIRPAPLICQQPIFLSRTWRKILNYSEWMRQLCVRSGALWRTRKLQERLKAQPTVMRSEHRYCNISHKHTSTSAWVIPKVFTTTSLRGRENTHTKGFREHGSVLSFRHSLRHWIQDM